MKLGQGGGHPLAQPLQQRRSLRNRIPFARREHQRPSLPGNQPGDRQILSLERLQRIHDENDGLGKADRAQRVADAFLALALPECTRNGEVVAASALSQ